MSTIYRAKQKPHRRYLRRFLVTASTIAILGGGIYVVVYTQLFTIQSIKVTGNTYLASAEIVPYTPPFSYFKYISVSNTAIASSTIKKDFLKRSLSISVQERERYGIWCATKQDGNQCFWFDRTGILFDGAAQTHGDIIKAVLDNSGEQLIFGGYILEERFIQNLISIFDILEENEISFIEMVLDKRENQEVVIRTKAGLPLYFSIRDNPAFTNEALRKLKEEFSLLQYIDFRSRNRVFFEYK